MNEPAIEAHEAGPSASFNTTHWSVVLRAVGPDTSQVTALEQLCQTYWPPLYVFLRREGWSSHEAQDVVQGFFERFLAKDYLLTVSPNKGRFRSFLLASLRHYAANIRRDRQTERRGGKILHLDIHDPVVSARCETALQSQPQPELAFDRVWAETVMHNAAQRLRKEYAESGKGDLYEIIRVWLASEAQPGKYAAAGQALDLSVALAYGGFKFEDEQLPTSRFYEYTYETGWIPRGDGPSARAYAAMAYDERRKRIVMVGGVGNSPSVGEEAYEYVPNQGWLAIPRLPENQGRAGAKMVYDRKRGVMVLTGGAGGGAENAEEGGRYSDTWELVPTLSITTQPVGATNEVCADAQFSVVAEGVAPFQYTWRRDGYPLTEVADFARYSGVSGPVLTIRGLRHSDAGKYDVEVKDSCGEGTVVTSQEATLTITPPSQWVPRGTNGPPARFGHAMAYDSKRGVTVLFGGRTNSSSAFSFNDLWEWDGALWTLRMADSRTNGWANVPRIGWVPTYSGQPVQRSHFAMAYDTDRKTVVLFGGTTASPSGSGYNLKDLWEWDGTEWHFRATNGPVPRLNASMAYDESRKRMVLFGGYSDAGFEPLEPGNLVAEWDGDGWHTYQPGVGPQSYYAQVSSMAYDSARGVAVLGPTTPAQVFSSAWVFWEWNGAYWKQYNRLDYGRMASRFFGRRPMCCTLPL